MQRVWNKYGEEAFEFRVLLHCDPKDAVANEQKFIDELKPVFNTLPFAGTTFGFKHSKETREKMRARRMKDGKKHLVKGEYLTLREIKNKYGFSRACLQERLKRGETGDALVAPHRVSHEGRGQKYLIHGEMIDVACMIEKYGVTEDLVRGRLKSGWSGDDLVAPTTSFAEIGRAVGQRNKEAAVRYEVGGELLTISEIAEKYDLTIGTIRGRLARGEFGLDLVAPPSRPGPGTATKYLVMGEMLTSAEVKEKYGIEEATLRQRIKYGWEGEDLIKPPQKKMFLVRGETLTMTQVSKKYGIAMPTLCQRAKAGKDGEDLIERPIIGRKPTHAA
jgi:transposase